jgi:hypothetical protein
VKAAQYLIQRRNVEPEFKGCWDGPSWKNVEPLEIAAIRPEGSDHRPVTQCKLQYGEHGLYGLFKVQDKYIRCVHHRYQSDVYKDSCVEIFLQPKSGFGYFNFEFNCGGCLLASYITDPSRADGKIKHFTPLSLEADHLIRRYHSLPALMDPECTDSKTWYLEFFIPFELMADFVGEISTELPWRGNLFKCGDETSHPHWLSWSGLGELNFHDPRRFGRLNFAGARLETESAAARVASIR